MAKRIIFLNSSVEVCGYIDRYGRTISSEDLIIALTPSVQNSLKKKGFASQDTLTYFTENSHKEILIKSEILMKWLRDNFKSIDNGLGVNDAYKEIFIHWIRKIIINYLWTIEIVENAINEHKPEVLSASLCGKKTVYSFYVESEEKYFGWIVKIIAEKKGKTFEDISKTRGSNYLFIYIAELIISLRQFIELVLRYVRFQLFERYYSFFIKKGSICYASKLYGIDKLATEFNKKGISSYFLMSPAVSSFDIPEMIIKLIWKKKFKTILAQKGAIKNLITSIENEPDVFSYKGIPIGKLIYEKIKGNLSNHLLHLYIWTIKLNNNLDALKPFAIVSNGVRSDELILAELCRKKNIPAILISHGSHVRPKNKFEQIEWGEHGSSFFRAAYSMLALQSPLAEGYLDAFPALSKIVRTGPLIWGKPIDMGRSKLLIRKILKEQHDAPNVKVVLHAGSSKPTNALRLYVYETPDEYIHALCDLANAVEKVPGTVLIIKFRPSAEISVEDLKCLVPFSKKVLLSVKEPFLDMLGMADLLVSFSSTTIEEALQNKIPVLLYGGNGRYQHVRAFEVRPNETIQESAVYYVKDQSHLEYALNNILPLDLKNERYNSLFEPFIYNENIRESLSDILTKGNYSGG